MRSCSDAARILALPAGRSPGQRVPRNRGERSTSTVEPARVVPLTACGLAADGCLSVAEAIAWRCHRLGIRKAFAYPGTSELALCRAFATLGDGILVNSRGDREAVFMAGGGGLSGRPDAVAIVHGARGLTNAAGAVADLRRNEVPALVIVGLPSTASARFLPPHGEDGLLDAVGAFAKDVRQVVWPRRSKALASGPIEAIDAALVEAGALPRGPVLLGVPQDILEARVVPAGLVTCRCSADVARPPAARVMRRARALLRGAKAPVILIDDYLLRHRGAQTVVVDLAERLDASIYQVCYRRGPMLFQQLTGKRSPTFAGLYDPDRPEHRDRLASADLLVTIEDRNLYPRVVGRLPDCPKIAVTSNPAKTKRNGYLGAGDVVIDGDPIIAIAQLAQDVPRRRAPATTEPAEHDTDRDGQSHGDTTPPPTPRERLQDVLAGVVRGSLAVTDAGHVVDDSQMAGGMLAGVYERAFGDATVIGDHAGFVGAGIPSATGLAVTTALPVLCLLGDQGFTNGSQGLVCAAYGPGQTDPVQAGVVSSLCLRAGLADPDGPLEVWGDPDTERAFIWVDDAIDALVTLMASDHPDPVNIGTGEYVTIQGLAELVCRTADKRLIARMIPGPSGAPRDRLDTGLIRSLGWQPTINLAQGVDRLYRWAGHTTLESAP